MKKKIISSILAFVIVIGSLFINVFADSANRLQEIDLNVNIGEYDNVIGGAISISYSPEVCKSVSGIWNISNTSVKSFNTTNEQGVFMLTSASKISGNIFSIKAKVNADAEYNTDFTVSATVTLTLADKTNITVPVTVCQITIVCSHENLPEHFQCSTEQHWKICDDCNESVQISNHEFDNACDATCNVCGYVRSITHSYQETWNTDEENHWHECSVCHDKKDMGTHSGGTATCKAKAVCEICGVSYGDYTDHTYGSWIPEEPATHDANGVKGHYHCSVCGKDFDSSKNELSSLVITKDANHGLPAEDWKSDATYHWHECKVVGCGVVIDSTKAEHTFEWKTDKPATEDEIGLKHEECSVCGLKRNEGTPIEKLDHTHTGITHHAAKAATCKATGNIEYWTCSSPKCAGKFYSEETCTVTVENVTVPVDENNHLHTEIRGKKDATCTEDGYTGDTYCTDCVKKIKDGEAIKATGHTYENGKCETCGAKDPNYTPTNPDTADNSHMTLWIILASVSCLGILALTFTKKKRTVR